MPWFTAVVVYFLLWWFVLFAVLPFGTKPVDAEIDAGGWRGVPEKPMLGRKLLATTVIAFVLWLGAMAIILQPNVLSFRQGWLSLHKGQAF